MFVGKILYRDEFLGQRLFERDEWGNYDELGL